MNRAFAFRSALGLAACLALALPAASYQPPAGEGEPPTAAEEAMQKEMEAWAAANQVGEHHAHLKAMEGDFKTDLKFWMAPGTEPMASTGKVTNKMILDGRYLEGHFVGDPDPAMGGMVFYGQSLMGYDTMAKEYFSTWIDSMTTGLMISRGTCSSNGKTFTLTGDMPDPMTGKTLQHRMVITIDGPDKHTMRGYEKGADGKEFQNMEIVYTRAK